MPMMSIGEMPDEGKEFKETMTVDVDEKQISKFKIGDKVTMVVKGTVGMLQVPRDGEPSKSDPPMMGIKVDSKKINGMTVEEAQMDDLANDDEENDESTEGE